VAAGTDHSIKEMLDAAAASIKRGNIASGKASLISVLEREPDNVSAWLWMSRCFQDRENKLRCFRKVLEIDPNNSHAIEGIRLFSFSSHTNRRKSSASLKWLGLGIGGAVLFVLVGSLSAYAFGLVQLPSAMPAVPLAISTEINVAKDETIGETESEESNSLDADPSSTKEGLVQQQDVAPTTTPVPPTLAPSTPTSEPPAPTPTTIPPTTTNIPPTATGIPPTDIPPTPTNIPPTPTPWWTPSPTPGPFPGFVSCSVDPPVVPALATHNIYLDITCQVSLGGQPIQFTMWANGAPEGNSGGKWSCEAGSGSPDPGIADCSIAAVRLGPGHTKIVTVVIFDLPNGWPDVNTQTSYNGA